MQTMQVECLESPYIYALTCFPYKRDRYKAENQYKSDQTFLRPYPGPEIFPQITGHKDQGNCQKDAKPDYPVNNTDIPEPVGNSDTFCMNFVHMPGFYFTVMLWIFVFHAFHPFLPLYLLRQAK